MQLAITKEQLMHVPTEVMRIEGELIHCVQKEEFMQVSQPEIKLEQGSHKSELVLKTSEVLVQLRQNEEELQKRQLLICVPQLTHCCEEFKKNVWLEH
jgi:hypothetical protein